MRRAWPLLAALVLLGCGQGLPWSRPSPPPPAPPARLEVEVLHGFSVPPARGSRVERVEILLDVSASLRGPAPAPYAVAKAGALRLLEQLPASTPVELAILGSSGPACGRSVRAGASEDGPSREALRARVAAAEPVGEGSLAEALASLRRDGEAGGARRVVVFSDLGEECGGDLCQAIEGLLATGARLELVVVGEAPVPACAERLAQAVAPSEASPAGVAPEAPGLRVEAQHASRGRVVLAEGRADGRALELAAGIATLVVELDPPARIGPLLLSPGALTRVRILEFPYLEGRVREWRWDTLPLELATEEP